MTNRYPKIFAALGTAAFLMATPLAAQDSSAGAAAGGIGGGGAEVYPELGVFFERLNPDKHRDVHQRFTGLGSDAAAEGVAANVGGAVPEGVATYPVPAEIYETTPELEGYEYFTLPDGRIAVVHPVDRTIEVIIG